MEDRFGSSEYDSEPVVQELEGFVSGLVPKVQAEVAEQAERRHQSNPEQVYRAVEAIFMEIEEGEELDQLKFTNEEEIVNTIHRLYKEDETFGFLIGLENPNDAADYTLYRVTKTDRRYLLEYCNPARNTKFAIAEGILHGQPSFYEFLKQHQIEEL